MIRKAATADLPGIGGIYEAIFDQEERGPVYTNWLRGSYPTTGDAGEALAAGTLYVGEENGVLWGVVNLNGVQLPEYGKIPWTIPAGREEVGVVAFCEKTARAQGKTVIRLDTWEGNAPANHLYPSLGYSFAGGTEFFFHGYIREILNCYEKKL